MLIAAESGIVLGSCPPYRQIAAVNHNEADRALWCSYSKGSSNMKRFVFGYMTIVTLFFWCVGSAHAGSASAVLSITVQAPLAVVLAPASTTESCSAAPGTVVSAASVTGGDGNAVTWSMSGDTTDFALSGTNIVVASAGITSADCGKVNNVTVTATQP